MRSAVLRFAAVWVCLSACGSEPGASPVTGPVLVSPERVAVLRADRSIAAVGRSDGEAVGLGQVPLDVGEVDGLAVSPDGRLVLVSALQDDDDAPEVCRASVLQMLPDGTTRQLAEGASIALSPTGDRLAYFRYDTVDGFCRRTELVVLDFADAAETTVTALEDVPVGGTPPEWPISWSPDGSRTAHVTDEGAVETEVDSGKTEPVADRDADRPLAPGYLADGRLLTMYGCCTSGGTMRSAGPGEVTFEVPGPVRSVRASRSGAGAWLTSRSRGSTTGTGTASAR